MPSARRFDYIVVGAGSAGCVLAARLTEDPSTTVLLLEAGGSDRHPYLSVPIGLGKLTKHRLFDWHFVTEPEESFGGRRPRAQRGKVLGGSSSINVMAFTRGQPGDFDRWERNGATGWSYADVLPYFRRLETWEGGESAYRGGAGPIGVRYARSRDPLFAAWFDAAKTLGFPVVDDYNAEQPIGFGRSQQSIRDGRRSSTSAAYLRPALRRANLTVATNATAQRIIFEGTRARGIAYAQGGQMISAEADREVLLSAGAFNSPHLLMLSGIGPADHLRALDIAPVTDLPVGSNLQDHLTVTLQWRRISPGPFRSTMRLDRAAAAMVQAYAFGSGPATVLPSGLYAFVATGSDLSKPDLEFMFRAAPIDADVWFPGWRRAYDDGFAVLPALLQPKSRGEVRLRSADPADPILIRHRFFSHPDDLPVLRRGVKLARELAAQAALDDFRGAELQPGPGVESDDDIDAWVRATAETISHPLCTCPMGTGDEAVVGPDFRVRGIDALRVIDGSAMPDIISAHPNAAIIMMAERAADDLRGRSRLGA